MSKYVVVCYAIHATGIDKHKWFDKREEAEAFVKAEVERTSAMFPGNDTVAFHGLNGYGAVFNSVYHWQWHILSDEAATQDTADASDSAKYLTGELQDAIEIVCEACPRVSDCEIDEELVALVYGEEGERYDGGAKYCDHCMVRNMHNLYSAIDEAGGSLPYASPEWQAIINY